ncbi:MAG: ECF-type sigma factor [Phycisphaerales bacterium]
MVPNEGDLLTPPPMNTEVVSAALAGDSGARDALLAMVYDQLRASARQQLSAERPGHTLSATALVHEAFLRLVGPRDVPWANRAHFYKAAAEAMRHVLLDHAKSRSRIKRGGGRDQVPLGDSACLSNSDDENSVDHISVDGAICRLGKADPEMAELVRLRYYAGLTCEEAALVLGVTEKTVRNRWKFATAWLAKEIET